MIKLALVAIVLVAGCKKKPDNAANGSGMAPEPTTITGDSAMAPDAALPDAEMADGMLGSAAGSGSSMGSSTGSSTGSGSDRGAGSATP